MEILRLFKERYGRIDWHVRCSKMMKQTGKGLLSNLSNQKNNSFLKENWGIGKRYISWEGRRVNIWTCLLWNRIFNSLFWIWKHNVSLVNIKLNDQWEGRDINVMTLSVLKWKSNTKKWQVFKEIIIMRPKNWDPGKQRSE